MIDLHSHILTDTDDGANSFSESVALIYEARKAGFTGIVCTPHYMKGFYEKNIDYVDDRIQELGMDSKRVGVHLYKGNEVYVSDEISKLLDDKKITGINNSKYLMIEFPVTEDFMKDGIVIINEIVKKGYIPIIAHPERYPCVQKDIKIAKDFLKNGALLQVNYASIDGYYGIQPKKTVIKLLKNKMVQFLGSDVHKKKTIYVNIKKYIKELSKYLSEDEIDELSYKNPIRVIHNENVIVEGTKI